MIDIEIDHNKGTQAAIFLYEETLLLSETELQVFIGRCRTVLDEIRWNKATWVHAKGLVSSDTTHLLRKQDDPHGKALCGTLPPSWGILGDKERAWERTPVLGEPVGIRVCKKCFAIWQKAQQEK